MIRWLDISGGFLRSINIQYSCISILWLQCSYSYVRHVMSKSIWHLVYLSSCVSYTSLRAVDGSILYTSND